MPTIPFLTKKPPAPTLADLQKRRTDAVAARDRQGRELEELKAQRLELATAGDDPDAVKEAGGKIHALTDSIELAGSVIANLDLAIAPLERAAAERTRAEQLEAAKLTHSAAHNRALAAAKAVQASLEQVTEELEQRCATLDAANAALAHAAQPLANAGVDVNVHEVVRAFDPGMAPFMEQLLREIRQIPKRLAEARASVAGLRRCEEGERQRAAELLARQHAAYLGSPQANEDLRRAIANEERNRAAASSPWGRQSPAA